MANESAKFMKNAYIGWTNTHGMYYPPDYDPGKLVPEKKYNREKFLKDKNQPKGPKTMSIRMMMPFSMICGTCGNFTYVATKFNSKVEKLDNESYYGCAIYRFYGKCQHCCATFTFKTDPATADYVMETGGSRSYECWKDADDAVDEVTKTKEDEAANDAMKALEQASASAAAEMQINDALEGQQEINKRLKNPYETITQALEFLYKKRDEDGGGAEDFEDPADFDDEIEAYRKEQLSRKRKEMDEEIEEHDHAEGSSVPSKRIKIEQGIIDDSQTDPIGQQKNGFSRTLTPAKKMAPPSSIIIKKKMAPPPTVKIKIKAVKEEKTMRSIPEVATVGEEKATMAGIDLTVTQQLIPESTPASIPETTLEEKITSICSSPCLENIALSKGDKSGLTCGELAGIAPEKPEEPVAAAPLAFGAYDSDSASD